MDFVNSVLKSYEFIQELIASMPFYIRDWLYIVFSVIGIAAIINATKQYLWGG